jgi:hypothetical protein
VWSSIELFLPDGFVRRRLVIGSGPVPQPGERPRPEGAPADLVVVAPSGRERRDSRWRREAVAAARAALAPGGSVLLLGGGAGSAYRTFGGAGLRPVATLLHAPDVERSRYVVPVGTLAGRFARSGGIPVSALKQRLAAAFLRAPLLARLVPSSTLLRQPGSLAVGRWLFDLDGSRPGSVLVASGGPRGGSRLAYRFPLGAEAPDAVAKVSPRAGDELRTLSRIASAAGRAGACVPRPLASGAGRSVATLLAEGRLRAGAVQTGVARWLQAWGSATLRRRPLREQDLGSHLLAKAELLPLGPERERYQTYLRSLCARAAGAACPFVAAHRDLTAANLVVDANGSLGVVDWEEAVEESLPLADFLYLAADAVAAERGYADRVEAFRACFSPEGRAAAAVAALRRQLAGSLDLPRLVQEVCFHACWLHHAANEAARSAGSADGPFVAIVKTIAADPDRFAEVEP